MCWKFSFAQQKQIFSDMKFCLIFYFKKGGQQAESGHQRNNNNTSAQIFQSNYVYNKNALTFASVRHWCKRNLSHWPSVPKWAILYLTDRRGQTDTPLEDIETAASDCAAIRWSCNILYWKVALRRSFVSPFDSHTKSSEPIHVTLWMAREKCF